MCEQRMHAAADQLSRGLDIDDDGMTHVVHMGEDDFVLWCQRCGALLEQQIEGDRTYSEPEKVSA